MNTSELISIQERKILLSRAEYINHSVIIELYDKLDDNKQNNWEYHYYLGCLAYHINTSDEIIKIYDILKYNNSCLLTNIHFTNGFLSQLRLKQ